MSWRNKVGLSSHATARLGPDQLTVMITKLRQGVSLLDQVDYSTSVATCERTVYMPGSVPMELVMADGYPDADILTAYDMNSYVSRYGRSDLEGS